MSNEIIDLETGELVGANDQQPKPIPMPQPTPSNDVIDLETGDLVPALAPIEEVIASDPNMSDEQRAVLSEVGAIENQLFKSGEWKKAFRMALGSMLSTDDAQHIKVVQEVLPEANIRTLENGETIIDYQDKEFMLNKPGMSPVDFTRFFGQFAAFLPEGKVAQISRIGMEKLAKVPLLKRIAGGAAVQRTVQMGAVGTSSAGTSIALDSGASIMGGGEASEGISKERAVLSGIFGGTGELIGPAYRGVMRKFRNTPDDLKYIDIESVAHLKKAEEITGIQLFTPQATRSRSDSAYMKILQDLPSTHQEMLMLLSRQNDQAANAVTRLFADIGDSQSIINAPKELRDMAQYAITDMKVARSTLVEQGYKEAFAEGVTINVSPILKQIDDALANTPSASSNPVRQELLKVRELIASDAPDGFLSLEMAHQVKLIMDDMTDTFGDSSITRSAKNAVQDSKVQLRTAMEEASPTYRDVKQTYIDASGPINDLENSLMGRIANITDDNLKRVLPTLFDATQSNPAVLQGVRDMIYEQSPETWNAIVRARLESQMGKIRTNLGDGVPNAPLDLYRAIFGRNNIEKSMIYDSLPPTAIGNFKWMEDALQAAARGRGMGSDTAAKQEAIRSLKEGSFNLFAWLNPLQWSKNADEVTKQAAFEARASHFVTLLTDPKWSSEMARLKELNPSDSGVGRALWQSLDRVAYEYEQEQEANQ